MSREHTAVPCNGCTACCRGGELIVLQPGEDARNYLCVPIEETPEGYRFALRQKENGDCVYLGPAGCTIHDRSPVVCRTFDCRGFFVKFDSRSRKRLAREDPHTKAIFAAGKARLHSLRVAQ